MLFSGMYKIMVNKVTFAGFRGAIASPGSAPVVRLVTIEQRYPIFLLPRTPSEFRQMSMYSYSISTDEHVPLKFFITQYFIMIIHRYV